MKLCLARFSAALFSIGSFVSSYAFADTISTWNSGDGNWSNAAQWTPSRVPNNNGNQNYAVTINNGTVALDISPTINTFTLNSGLTTGSDVSNGQFTTLTVNRNAVVNGGIDGPSFYGWFDSLAVGGNLVNNGFMKMGSSLNVAGNMRNAGLLIPYGVSGSQPGFAVGGTLLNTGSINWGNNVDRGSDTGLGGLDNRGSIFIGDETSVRVGSSSNDIPKSASWEIAGTLTGAFSNLKTIEGAIDLQNAITLGSPGNTIRNSGSLTLGTSYSGASFTANIIGNFSNSGNVVVGTTAPIFDIASSTLSTSGTFTNQANGMLNVNLVTNAMNTTPSYFDAQKLVNYGLANFQVLTASNTEQLVNYGTLNILGDSAGDVGLLTTRSVTIAGGLLMVWDTGGTLVVGSGTVPSGITGYYQFGNGVLNAAGGQLVVNGPVSLDGTLDIMLGDGYKPVGTVFTLLMGGPITGTFSNVEGQVFDDGRERYVINYDSVGHTVTATVEANSTPEPGSVFLALMGMIGIFAYKKLEVIGRKA